ncbi:autotransporter assembly complex family protein [Piscinibacter sp. HJYY11]|uniref:autotransporter assembly complex protein TamA n=1 Tax=Piscinibacter sp. HJYY11 TaxID=2801333 RepID=UPI00191F0E95|nr:BamA/TamA family outer membrane protein [Piscinibacter sp. HJYY11]MBL0730403.1 BamA/TamA family outer membrane protein [Piscinibacter sp. HJYY11]
MTFRSVARQGLGLLVMASLWGCANLNPDSPPAPPPENTPLAQAAQPAGPPASAADAASATVSYRVEVQAPDNLRQLLLTYLDLTRFQNAPQTDGITNAELIRLTAASPSQARSLLETEGYFNPTITVTRVDPPDETPLITLNVDPGPRAVIGAWELTVTGELKTRIDSGDKDALDLVERLRKRWPLDEGKPFSQSAWNSAKNGTLAQLRAEGYAAAKAGETIAHVDAKTNVAALAVELQSGPLFILGELKIEGLKRYNEEGIRHVADFGPGTPYSEKRLYDYQERLLKLNLFNSVAVSIEPEEDKAKAVPVMVRVTEQAQQQAVAGVGFSDNTRERLTVEHRHLRPLGYPVQMRNKFELGRKQRTWEGELLTDPGDAQYRKLLAGGVSRLDTDDDSTFSWKARAGRTLYTERIERLIFAELLNATVTNGLGEFTSRAVSGNYHWTWRDVDDIILPTRGLTTVIQGGAGYALSETQQDGPFARVYTRNTLYWPLPGAWFTQTRLEVAEVFAKDAVGIPDTLLFRAGGDESVRGYGYRDLGPLVNGVLTSGRQLLTGSFEIARPFSVNRPALWWAVFVDAGNATNEWADYKPALGYGLGVRWRSPVGPLRIDWAYGEEVRKARLHFSVGIAF